MQGSAPGNALKSLPICGSSATFDWLWPTVVRQISPSFDMDFRGQTSFLLREEKSLCVEELEDRHPNTGRSAVVIMRCMHASRSWRMHRFNSVGKLSLWILWHRISPGASSKRASQSTASQFRQTAPSWRRGVACRRVGGHQLSRSWTPDRPTPSLSRVLYSYSILLGMQTLAEVWSAIVGMLRCMDCSQYQRAMPPALGECDTEVPAPEDPIP